MCTGTLVHYEQTVRLSRTGNEWPGPTVEGVDDPREVRPKRQLVDGVADVDFADVVEHHLERLVVLRVDRDVEVAGDPLDLDEAVHAAALQAEPCTRPNVGSTSLFAHSVPVYPYTLAASSSLAWPLVPFPAQPGCLLIVYQCTPGDALFRPSLERV